MAHQHDDDPPLKSSLQGKPKPTKRSNVIFIHPDLGIGGAERLIIDAALALQERGHRVTIYTSHRDKSHCFEEARDGTLDVRVRGNTIFPPLLLGRFHLLMAMLRQLHLTASVLRELASRNERKRIKFSKLAKDVDKLKHVHDDHHKPEGEEKEGKEQQDQGREHGDGGDFEDDIFIVDQLPACVPILKTWGSGYARIVDASSAGSSSSAGSRRRGKQRILFYCHFPDQLLARRNEGSAALRLIKTWYRYPLDWFEGWATSAADKVVANSNFTRGVVKELFGPAKLGDIQVVYPCVDTSDAPKVAKKEIGGSAEKQREEQAVTTGELWGGKKILLSINRFERKKGIGLAIQAYHGLGKEVRKGTRLVIAGGYDNRVQENVQYHKELDTLALDLGLQTATSKTVISALSIPDSIDVLFLLSVPTAFKQTLLHNSKLLLYTPVNEHFGIVPVEAMHAGLPVLASNTGGPLETVVEGETGWLRDANKVDDWTAVMQKVLAELDDQDIARIAANGKKRVQDKFSLTAMGDNLESQIHQMLESDRPPFHGLQQILLGFMLSGIAAAVIATALLRRL